MAQSSFPVLEQPLSDQQWGQVTEGFGSGILARGSEPYGIPGGGIDNAANTVRLAGRSGITGDGRAVVSGFFHRYDADVTLSIPAVASTLTYYLGLTYDPTSHAAAGGPVSLTVTTARPAGGGKVYLPIYRITRRANELLSEATIVDERAFIAPSITVKGEAALPPADSVLTYTVATDFESGEQWQMNLAGSWARLSNVSVVNLWTSTGWTVYSSGVLVTRLSNGARKCEVEVMMVRSGSSFTQGSSFMSHGFLIPTSVRGSRDLYVPAMIGTSPGFVFIGMSDGLVQARLISGTTLISTGSRIAFSAMWVVS